jgi:hypothetical protein
VCQSVINNDNYCNYVIIVITVMSVITYCIQYDTIRYDTIRYDTIRYDTIRYDTIRYDTIAFPVMLSYWLFFERSVSRAG